MQVPLLDLRPQFESLKPAIMQRLEGLMDSQQFILGPAVDSFEKAICNYTGSPQAIGLSSGTDAQLALLMAEGIGPGDAVITTPFTFFATAGCVARLGARPIFVDIDPVTFNLCPEKLAEFLAKECRVEKGKVFHRNERVRAIIPVHLFGTCCDMDAIIPLAVAYGLPVWEDAAQALGADFLGQKVSGHAGCVGEAGWYSFFPAKNLGAFGDAGLLVCRDADLAERVRVVRNHGMAPQYYHHVVGGNFRIDAMQAAVLEIKLPNLDDWSQARRANADYYRSRLSGVVGCPGEPWSGRWERHHIYHQFVIRAPRRDELREKLSTLGIGSAVYYPVPLHLQKCFDSLGYRAGDMPVAEAASGEVLALPIFPELGEERREFVAQTILDFYGSSGS